MRWARGLGLLALAGGSGYIALNPVAALRTPLLAAHSLAVGLGIWALAAILAGFALREGLYGLADALERRLERRKARAKAFWDDLEAE